MLENKEYLVKSFVNLFLIVIGAFFLVESYEVSPGFQQVVGADQYPRWFAVILIALCLASLIKDHLRLRRDDFTSEDVKLIEEMLSVGPRILVLFGLLIFYIYLIPFLGYFESGFIFLALAIFFLGQKNVRNLVYSLLFASGITLAVYFVFGVVMNIYLPTGILF
ncbi:tripartite tricarboxylate transporter TctB family protein [Halarsenatibacter silvermanii]|uniref:Tripartite tricarboxylate transporter TctB family protein n=1 Tax=Halarsenatibacter silvermanii TaxID=321763 RepID=A0A1G9QFR0_9FIRM|nr:tripartite tricarboxylate transporter TctB family protein [Halarsenatibacter silvermanii]SDM09823.1 Tripartite tricarboxylate transporter TctB family protein [Halarsenatibacter silvermanii]